MNQLENIFSQALTLFIAVPLLAFLAVLLLKNKQEKIIGTIVRVSKVVYIALAVICAAAWLINGLKPFSYHAGSLYEADHFVFAIYFYYDEITMVFSLAGSLLFFLVATFSKYYMHRDEGYKRFFSIILLFATGYNLIIFSGNFETLFIGWEVKGLCSFLLIAFYRNRYLPVKNAFKTVSNYRISDLALILAMWMMHHLTHQNVAFTQMAEARALAGLTHHTDMAVFIVSMFILAAVVKSAQFPFTTWLPRAMEGPTSSSAIFYGSLSVHIGVFLLLRTHAFWMDMLWAKVVIIVFGAITAIFATLMARVQPSVKTQIAYSSAAQIGIMFIEIALGFHWLVLAHFAGNAFLRTYQLLVSPSVLNYLVHHQYFHYHPPEQKPVSKWKATLYMLSVKEWNLDTFMYKYVWRPFKWIGRQAQLADTITGKMVLGAVAVGAIVMAFTRKEKIMQEADWLPEVLLVVALLTVLSAFASRRKAFSGWHSLLITHILIVAAVVLQATHIPLVEVILYGSGVLVAWLLGLYCLYKTFTTDRDILLNRYHGYVYEHPLTAFLFLLSAVGMLGFPVTASFIGIDVFFTHVGSGEAVSIMLLALCFIFIELAAIRIFLRIYLGPHKKLNHPVAFRSS